MFSPETYALLFGKIAGNTEAINGKWSVGTITIGSTAFWNAIDESYSNASNNSTFTGSANATTWCGHWYGLKRTASPTNNAIFFFTDKDKTVFGILTRTASDGSWTIKTIE